MSLQQYEGTCHCRAIAFIYQTALAPQDWAIRACQCSFCRRHAALSTSDPKGLLQFVEHVPHALYRYQFGQKTADFLLCHNCGVYVGAMMQSANQQFGIINARVLYALVEQLPEAIAMDYETESVTERLSRRAKRWTSIALPHQKAIGA